MKPLCSFPIFLAIYLSFLSFTSLSTGHSFHWSIALALFFVENQKLASKVFILYKILLLLIYLRFRLLLTTRVINYGTSMIIGRGVVNLLENKR